MKSFYVIVELVIICGVMIGTLSCATYFYTLYVPATAYNVARTLTDQEKAQSQLARLNEDMAKAGTDVTLFDTYEAAYGKALEDIPRDGDTGNTFHNMRAATRYFRSILSAEKIAGADHYLLTRFENRSREGFVLIAVVYRPDQTISVTDERDPKRRLELDPGDPAYYRPYETDAVGKRLDVVLEWAAVPADCFKKQVQQAVLLTAAANHLIQRQPSGNFWQVSQRWQSGDIASVVGSQDYLACVNLDMRG